MPYLVAIACLATLACLLVWWVDLWVAQECNNILPGDRGTSTREHSGGA